MKTSIANVGKGLGKGLTGIGVATLLFGQTLALTGCPNDMTQKEPPVPEKYPTMIGGDINFEIVPNWTNEQAVKAVNQALRHMTAQCDELIELYSDFYDEKYHSDPNLLPSIHGILNAQYGLRNAYRGNNIEKIKQADAITPIINLGGGGGGGEDAIKYTPAKAYLAIFIKANYLKATTNASPRELAVIQEELDALSRILTTDNHYGGGNSSLWKGQQPPLPKENLIEYLREKLSGYPPEIIRPRGASKKMTQQAEDYGQFMAFADDLTRMGHTLTGLSNRSVQQSNFIIRDDYTETVPDVQEIQELSGIRR